jgi:hypothetical protein
VNHESWCISSRFWLNFTSNKICQITDTVVSWKAQLHFCQSMDLLEIRSSLLRSRPYFSQCPLKVCTLLIWDTSSSERFFQPIKRASNSSYHAKLTHTRWWISSIFPRITIYPMRTSLKLASSRKWLLVLLEWTYLNAYLLYVPNSLNGKFY